MSGCPQSLFPPRQDSARRIVFYDGDCGLCQRTIRILLRLDRGRVLHFAPLQGKTAQTLLPEQLRNLTDLSTLVYLHEGKDAGVFYVKSEAVLRALMDVGGFGRLASVLLVLPQGFRDLVYGFTARQRHRWFPNAHCELPSADEAQRFLD